MCKTPWYRFPQEPAGVKKPQNIQRSVFRILARLSANSTYCSASIGSISNPRACAASFLKLRSCSYKSIAASFMIPLLARVRRTCLFCRGWLVGSPSLCAASWTDASTSSQAMVTAALGSVLAKVNSLVSNENVNSLVSNELDCTGFSRSVGISLALDSASLSPLAKSTSTSL